MLLFIPIFFQWSLWIASDVFFNLISYCYTNNLFKLILTGAKVNSFCLCTRNCYSEEPECDVGKSGIMPNGVIR